jgi:hypothetical protein
MGRDSPMPGKDGHGCLFKDRYFVIAGGEWCYPVSLLNITQPSPPCISDTRTYLYDLVADEWSQLAAPPYTMLRLSGACSADALFLVSGMSPNATAVPRGLVDSARLRMVEGSDRAGLVAPKWEWTMLPQLPDGANRWLGSAGVVDGWLVLAAGSSTCGFERAAASKQEDPGADDPQPRARIGSSHDPCTVACTDATRCPPWLPSYRLRLSGPNGFASAWEPVAHFPGGGLDVPNTAVVSNSMYVFGGWRANGPGMAAHSDLYNLDLPVPIVRSAHQMAERVVTFIDVRSSNLHHGRRA